MKTLIMLESANGRARKIMVPVTETDIVIQEDVATFTIVNEFGRKIQITVYNSHQTVELQQSLMFKTRNDDMLDLGQVKSCVIDGAFQEIKLSEGEGERFDPDKRVNVDKSNGPWLDVFNKKDSARKVEKFDPDKRVRVK